MNGTWTRFRRLAAVGGGLVCAATVFVGCAGPAPADKPQPVGKGNGTITSVLPAAETLRSPMDAAPNADGSVIFFTAIGEETSSLWRVPFTGGDPVEMATGFTAPVGLVVSSDDQTVFVADVAAEEQDTDLLGHIVAVPVAGGEGVVLDVTRGYAPKGLAVHGPDIYFTGTDPLGQRGVFVVRDPLGDAPNAGALDIVANGAPLSEPSGITAAEDGTLYVADASASFDETGAVIRIDTDGVPTPIVQRIHTGSPAGIVLTQDESALLVSGLDVRGTGGAQVYLVAMDSFEVQTANAGIAENLEAGGLHRARDRDFYAWSGATTVYALK
jgi:sugar lactone lactonase YvrE